MNNQAITDRMDLFNIAMKPAQHLITDEFYKYLKLRDFFISPNSTHPTDNYEGSLFDHSLEVTKKLVTFTKFFNLVWDRPESPYIIGMFHDLYKIDQYKTIYEQPTQPGVLPSYKVVRNDEPHTLFEGHGEKSIMILSEYIHLTGQEIMCIRYCKGDLEKKDRKIFSKVVSNFENVFWTHIADKHTDMVGDSKVVYDDTFFKILGF